MCSSINRHLYTSKACTSRNGAAIRQDGSLGVCLAGTNPEELLAAGWSASLLEAIGAAAERLHTALPTDSAIDAEVDLGSIGAARELRARLVIKLPGLDRDVAWWLVDAARETCPYSRATRGNVRVGIDLL